MTNFTSKQKEIVARKLGYDGPMQGFDEFIASSPALQAKYNMVTQKYVERMANGGMVKKYADGGNVTGATVTTDDRGVPIVQGDTKLEAAKIQETPDQIIETTAAPTTATTAKVAAGAAQEIAQPQKVDAATVTTATATPAVTEAMKGVTPAEGVVSEQAKVKAETMEPTATAVGQVQAAQLAEAQKVQAPAERKVEAGEMVTGTGVDMAKAEQVAQQTAASAAQGVVTEEMTVQGQLNKVLADFDAGNPPPWAAATMRAATAQLAARGLSASSMAGQAVIQAAMEAAVPIASQDAKVFQEMGMQNLSNRQQTAVLAAQQRAAFLGQEFDQTFQMKVANAAKVSDIANMNFTANQQIALENARMAQSVDLANLSNRQAVVMAEAAQIATLETQNLNNRQQAQVANAQAFLQMDMKNLDNEQQSSLFKAQQITQSILSDTAAENAAKQFNASSENQTNQFMATLATNTNQFNAAQKNAMAQFNVDQANSLEKFNSEQQNARDQFNANQRLVIDQSNAQWRRDISTANTAAINAANYLNAQNSQQLTMAEYNNQTQLYRDQVEMAWSSFEKNEDRATQIIVQQIASAGSLKAAEAQADSTMWASITEVATRWAYKS